MVFWEDYPVEMLVPPENAALVNRLERLITTHPARQWTDELTIDNGGWEGLRPAYVHCVGQRHRPSSDLMVGPARGPGWRFVELDAPRNAMKAPLSVDGRKLSFREELHKQRWDDHRYYHHSRINQSLHLLSACCFLTSYALLVVNPGVAALLGWLLAMVLRNFAIEFGRSHPLAIVAGLHPGTVDTALSKPFTGRVPAEQLFTPERSAAHLLDVIDRLEPADSGSVFAWDGQRIPY